MNKQGILQRSVIYILSGLLFYILLTQYGETQYTKYFVYFTSLVFLTGLLSELNVLLKRKIIGRIKGFRYFSFVFVFFAIYCFVEGFLSRSKMLWHGIDRRYIFGLIMLITFFMYNTRLYSITKKMVTDNGTVKIRIKIKDITEIKRENDIVTITGKNKVIQIDLNKMVKQDKELFTSRLNEIIENNQPVPIHT
jgi:hypothetical protein